MAEHDDDLHLDPELRDALRDLDYDDAGPPSDLRDRTIGAVRAQRPPGEAAARRRRGRRPAVIGGAIGVAAAAVLALVLVLGGGNTDPDRTLTLAGPAGAVTVEIRGDEATLRGDGERLPAGSAYELWTVTGDAADPQLRSAGTFRTDTDGAIDAELELPAGTPGDASLAVTREDDDDPAPSLPPVLSAS